MQWHPPRGSRRACENQIDQYSQANVTLSSEFLLKTTDTSLLLVWPDICTAYQRNSAT